MRAATTKLARSVVSPTIVIVASIDVPSRTTRYTPIAGDGYKPKTSQTTPTHQKKRKYDTSNKDPLGNIVWDRNDTVFSTFALNRIHPCSRRNHGDRCEDIEAVDGERLEKEEVDEHVLESGEEIAFVELADVDEVPLETNTMQTVTSRLSGQQRCTAYRL